MTTASYDLVVIGGGPAGYAGAIRAAQLGKRVVLVEKEKPGGTCLHWGCIPTKALLWSADLYRRIQRAEEFGIRVEKVEVDFAKVIQRSRAIPDRLAKGLEFLLKKNKVEYLAGSGAITAPGQVTFIPAEGKPRVLSTKHILLATGSRPRLIPNLPVDGAHVLTSREAMVLPKVPRSMAIIGGGAIGVEFASFFHAFGCEVILVEMLPQILPFEDEEIALELTKQFHRQGIRILTGTKLERAVVSPSGVRLEFSGKETASLETETVLLALGLEPNFEGALGAGIRLELERGWVKTDGSYQTSMPGVFAAGDVIGPPHLAHVAFYEAVEAVEGMFTGHAPRKVEIFPSCIYSHPQVASVGLSEREARKIGKKIKIGKFPFLSLGKAVAMGDNTGFVKILFAEPGGGILGAHLIGAEVTELIGELALGMTMKAGSGDIISTIHAHPTLSEAIAEAAAASEGRAIHL